LKTITLARREYQAKGDLTEARIWRVVRKDGTVFRFTNNDVDLTKAGERYAARTGVNASAVANTASLAVDNMEVSGFLHSASITESDISAGRWDAATIFVADVNFRNVAQGQTIIAVGTVGNISAGRIGFTVECRSLSQMLSQNIGRTVTSTCDADVFDARCGVDPAPYIVTGSVTATSDNKHFSDSTRTEAAPWFDFGLVTWTSGENIGLSEEIKMHTGGDFTLQLRMPFTIEIDDEYSILPGCNKMLYGIGRRALVDTSADEWAPNATFYGTDPAYQQAWDEFWAAHLAAFGETPRTSAGSNLAAATQQILASYMLLNPTPVSGDCKTKYSNVDNFRGFPDVPGLNRTVGEGNAPA